MGRDKISRLLKSVDCKQSVRNIGGAKRVGIGPASVLLFELNIAACI